MLQIRKGLSYDDVLLVPKHSTLNSRKDVSLKTKLTKNLSLNVPLVAANMDSVTGYEMAISLALHGGIGIIHQFMPKAQQAAKVRKVKRAMNDIVEDPYSILETSNLGDAIDFMDDKGISGILVVDKDFRLSGILTRRDILFQNNLDKPVSELMTKNGGLITAPAGTTVAEAKKIFIEKKIEKLPLVDNEGRIAGLVTTADLKKKEKYPSALRDSKGRLMVAAAVGVKPGFLERTELLLEAGANCIVVDIAHGHSDLAINTIKGIKEKFPNVEILAGNVATGDATRALIEAGADGLKVGVGPGAGCSTRIVAGAGVPQITAIMDCVKVAKELGVPICADGGIKNSGDLAKAIAAGAHSAMMGWMFAGTAESPGRVIIKEGKRFKHYRGSASIDANISRQSREKGKIDVSDYTAEGVDHQIPYKGPVEDIIRQLLGGLRSGISYCGATSIEECQENSEFVEMTSAGFTESKPRNR